MPQDTCTQSRHGTRRLAVTTLLAAALAMLVAMLMAGPALATHVDPVLVPGNPDCQDLGYEFGVKIDTSPTNGTYQLGDDAVVVVPSDDSLVVTITNATATTFDWSTNIGVDAVIVKGGPNANSYTYVPEATADTGLHAPVNPSNGTFYGLSHVEFCYDLEVVVTKTAVTSFTRTWDWDVTKEADQTSVMISDNQSFVVGYTVTASTTGSVDSDWAVSGVISIANPHPTAAASVTGVTDMVSGLGAVAVDCGGPFPIAVAAGATLECTYSTPLPDASSRTNTATATTTGAVGGGQGSAPVTFSATPTTEVDECVDVTDTNVGILGTVCADGAPEAFVYTLSFGTAADNDVVVACGDTSHDNTATVTTNDTGTEHDDTVTVDVEVLCASSCTLTQGYWKTHSQQGPAPYDADWANLGPMEEQTTFFLSGKTWHQTFWTPPAGNVYYVLAHQYQAATLNVLDGASAPAEVTAALSSAQTLFSTTTPAQAAGLKGGSKQAWTGLASLLDDYNNGLVGPGHCDGGVMAG
ncbi:hypothetical protein [Salsipaludibacter albus]|uniref:hypothetical protein n=1 Tax=Salsipaludibacter albus TaxID=2849650 RepID=UPI001EE4CA36|nr:hypothetical protein [Salsipaludibacter albus]MBY5163313.1 hypothetical protein [Salsipaludibacter albus]